MVGEEQAPTMTQNGKGVSARLPPTVTTGLGSALTQAHLQAVVQAATVKQEDTHATKKHLQQCKK